MICYGLSCKGIFAAMVLDQFLYIEQNIYCRVWEVFWIDLVLFTRSWPTLSKSRRLRPRWAQYIPKTHPYWQIFREFQCFDSYSLFMMTSWIGNIFRVTGLGEGKSPVTDGFPSQRLVTRSLDVFFDLRLDERLSKQSRRRWFETLSSPLWHHCNSNDKFSQPKVCESGRIINGEFCIYGWS